MKNSGVPKRYSIFRNSSKIIHFYSSLFNRSSTAAEAGPECSIISFFIISYCIITNVNIELMNGQSVGRFQ